MGVLLPYQKKWIEDKSQIKICEKSRRVGLSWSEAADDTLFAASKDGGDVWYIGYNKDMAREFINDCANWARYFTEAASEMEEVVIDDEGKDIISFRIKFASGLRITALSSRPTGLRGKQGRVVIDEAAFHENLEGLIKAAIALTIWGGEVRIISTHFGEDNPFNDIIKDCRAGKLPYSVHRITLDEALKQGLYKRICKAKLKKPWSPEVEKTWRQKLIDNYREDAAEELFCIPSQGGGFYFTRVMVEQCMNAEIPVIRWQRESSFAAASEEDRKSVTQQWLGDNLKPLLDALDPNLVHYFGEDFGRSGDLTVICPLTELPNLKYRMPFQVELRNVPFEQQRQILFYIVDNLPRFRAGCLDARGNGQYLAEVAMQRYGETRIEQVMPTVEWYRNTMPKYKAALEDKSVELPQHADILGDHRVVKMDKGVARIPDNVRTKGTDGGQRHGDSAVAGAMAWAARDIEAVEIEFQSTGVQRDYAGMESYIN